MNHMNIEYRTLNINRNYIREEVEDLLSKQGLLLEKDVDYTIGVYDNDLIIGTGSLSGNVLKSIAIDEKYQGMGISNRIISLLIDEEYNRGNSHLFIFTKPDNLKLFQDMGFREIESVEGRVSLLENDPRGIEKYVEEIGKSREEGDTITSIVMNCNPFTLGHQYLIEQASRSSDIVHIFLVWEDRSLFPNEVRLKLLQEGTKHLKNVRIHRGKDYIISNATFPSYFLKEKNKVVKSHAMLDIKIFGKYIGPALGINQRIVGHEPNDPVTREYNETMKELLPKYNIRFIEIERLETDKDVISASRVRKKISQDKIEDLQKMLPETTYNFIVSNEAKPIINKIKEAYKNK